MRIAADRVLWMQRYHLDPMETKAIDIAKLIASDEKDRSGKTLPKGATVGEVNWSTEEAGEGTGRLLVLQPETCFDRNFSCGNQVLPCGSYMEYADLDLLAQESGDMGLVFVEYCAGANACTGGSSDCNSEENFSSTSSNSGIASVPGTFAPSCSVTGHSGGTATILAQGRFSGWGRAEPEAGAGSRAFSRR